MLDTWQNCVLIPSFPSSSPEPVGATITAALFTRFSPSSFFLRLVSHDNYFSYFSLVYTSLYLVKFSKFTIKITYGFFFVSQVVTISPCVTNTQCALANAPISLFRTFFSASRLSLNFSLALFHAQSRSHTITLPFTLTLCVFFFQLFTLMRGLKSSNKVCLLKNSSYSAFLLPYPRPFFFFFSFSSIYLSRSLYFSLSLSPHRDVPK